MDNGLNNRFINNYWSDSENSDWDDNGIVDVKYKIRGGSENMDKYPLMSKIDLSEICSLLPINIYPSIYDQFALYLHNNPFILIMSLVIIIWLFNEWRMILKKKRLVKKINANGEKIGLFPEIKDK